MRYFIVILFSIFGSIRIAYAWGEIGPTSELEIRLETNSMPLNNGGDEIRLIAPGAQVVNTVRYERTASGEVLRF